MLSYSEKLFVIVPLARFQRREFPLLSFEYLAPSESGVERLSLVIFTHTRSCHTDILLLSSSRKHFPYSVFTGFGCCCFLLNHTFAVCHSVRSRRVGSELKVFLPVTFTGNPEICDSAGPTLMESVLHSQFRTCSHQCREELDTAADPESGFLSGKGSDKKSLTYV